MRMNKQQQIDRLHTLLKDRHEWTHEREGTRLVATVGDMKLTIDGVQGHRPLWMVEADGYGVLLPWTPARDTSDAILNATEFARAYVLGLHEEQHAG